MSKDNTFTVNIDGKDEIFDIRTINANDQREAQKRYNQAFSDALKSGSIVRAKLDDLLKEQGLWDDNKELQFNTIQKELLKYEKQLSKGGISLKDARNIAIEMKKLREEMRELISVKTNLDSNTAEGQADNARFNYLVSVCVVYNNTKQQYFESYDDYLNRSTEMVAIYGAQKLANMLYGLDNDYEKKLPENKFLLKYKLVNDQLQYIDNKGRRTDVNGKLVDSTGRYINENGEYVDIEGNLINKDGDYLVEFTPFLDENGKPIVEEKSNDEVKTQETTDIPEKAEAV